MSAKATSVKSSNAFDDALIATDRGTGALGGRSSPRSSAPCSPLRCERDEFRRSNKFLLPAKANVSSQLESARKRQTISPNFSKSVGLITIRQSLFNSFHSLSWCNAPLPDFGEPDFQ